MDRFWDRGERTHFLAMTSLAERDHRVTIRGIAAFDERS